MIGARSLSRARTAPEGEIVMERNFRYHTWHAALTWAWQLVHENGWRYRVYRDGHGMWTVVRAGRRKARS